MDLYWLGWGHVLTRALLGDVPPRADEREDLVRAVTVAESTPYARRIEELVATYR